MNKKALNKEKIQQAAFRCVARHGFEKTTLEDIAKEVGLNKATLYYYYKNKEDILLDISTAATRQSLESLKSGALAAAGGITAKLRYFLLERALYYLRMVQQMHISAEHLGQVEQRFRSLVSDVHEAELVFLGELLDRAAAEGEIRATDSRMLAQQLIALSEAAKQQAKAEHPGWRLSGAGALEALVAARIDFMLGLIVSALRP